MSTPESPTETLRRAAAKVRISALGTTEGRRYLQDAPMPTVRARWSAWPSDEYDQGDPEFVEEIKRGASCVLVSVPGGVESVADRVRNWRDGRWIALVSPAVAAPLAAWLEIAAAESQSSFYGPNRPHPALALAHALLGEDGATGKGST